VHEIGSGVTNVEVGDTVIVHPFISCGLCRPCRPRGRHALHQRLVPGHQPRRRLRELLLTSARSVVKLDPSLQPAVDRRARRRGLTAIHAVKKAIPCSARARRPS
jgi:NAD+-dependent secondary alcohol dehydrogenase Adh1